jgi:hypothetical protein
VKTWIGGAVIATGLALVAPGSVAATNSKAGIHATEASKTTDLSARRRNRYHRHYAYRPHYRPYYCDRPYDYRPYPYQAPVPFFLGFGFGPSW